MVKHIPLPRHLLQLFGACEGSLPRVRHSSSPSRAPLDKAGHGSDCEAKDARGKARTHSFCRFHKINHHCHGRPRLFIQRRMLRNMMAKDRFEGGQEHAMLWLLAYVFLLRVPSEVPCVQQVQPYGGLFVFAGGFADMHQPQRPGGFSYGAVRAMARGWRTVLAFTLPEE